jgi:hypothetical protein
VKGPNRSCYQGSCWFCIRRKSALEASHFQAEIEVDRGQYLQCLTLELVVPSTNFRKSIIGDLESASLRIGQMLQPYCRNFFHSQLAAGEKPAMPCENFALRVYEDRNIKPEGFEAASDLTNLKAIVMARVFGVGPQLKDAVVTNGDLSSECRTLMPVSGPR